MLALPLSCRLVPCSLALSAKTSQHTPLCRHVRSISGQHASADDRTESGIRYGHRSRSSLASMYKAPCVHGIMPKHHQGARQARDAFSNTVV